MQPLPRMVDAGSNLTPDQRRAYAAGARAELSRRNLRDFVRYSWAVLEPGSPVEWSWHIDAVCDHIQWQLEDWARAQEDRTFVQRGRNTLINMPPRCLKSRIVSVCASAWAWLHWPHLRIMCLSANPRVAERDARFTMQLINSGWYQSSFNPTWQIKGDQDAASNFGNTAGGTRVARGLDSKVVGEGADWLIIDDPHDPREVYSEPTREGVHERYDGTVANRVNNPRTSIRTGVMQRLHPDDWAARRRKDGWACLILPMEYEPKYAAEYAAANPYGWKDPRTKEGEVLHPTRFTPAVLAEEKRRGTMYYAAQFQQRPSSFEGGIFKRVNWRWFKPEKSALALEGGRARPEGCLTAEQFTAEPLPRLDWLLITVDAAFKSTTDGSRVGMLVIGGNGSRRYIVDNVTRPMTFTETCNWILALKQRHPHVTRVLIEDKANGPAIVNTLKSKVSGLIEVTPEGGKVARAMAVQPAQEAGDIYLPEGAEWLEGETDFMGEVSGFPNYGTDDQVDALTQALTHMGADPDVTAALELCRM